MTTAAVLTISSGAFGVVGSIILAFSLNGVLSEIGFARFAMEQAVVSIARNETDVIIVSNLAERMEKAQGKATLQLYAGISFLVVGFICQSLSVL
jgi:hypothetical protein